MEEPLYNEIKKNFGNKSKSFELKYFIDEKDSSEIFIFGEVFVKNNKDKCHLIINEKDYELRTKYKFKTKGEQTITLVIDQEITNFSNMFYFGAALFSYHKNNLIDASSLENLDTSKCENFSFMFCRCKKLQDFDFLLGWDVSNCKTFNDMFKWCDFSGVNFLSKWNMKNAVELKYLFGGCCNLKDLEGIQNWDVGNVENFKGMFNYCSNITDFNALQNWNMNKAKDVSCMFSNCVNLVNNDFFYKWNLNEKVKQDEIFYGCEKIEKNIKLNNKSPPSSCLMF